MSRCLFAAENALAVVVTHCLRYLPRPFPVGNSAGTAASQSPYAVNGNGAATDGSSPLLDEAAAALGLYQMEPPGERDAAKLGSTADIAYFMSRLQVRLVSSTVISSPEGRREGAHDLCRISWDDH